VPVVLCCSFVLVGRRCSPFCFKLVCLYLRALGVLLRLLNYNPLLLNEKRAMHILKKGNHLSSCAESVATCFISGTRRTIYSPCASQGARRPVCCVSQGNHTTSTSACGVRVTSMGGKGSHYYSSCATVWHTAMKYSRLVLKVKRTVTLTRDLYAQSPRTQRATPAPTLSLRHVLRTKKAEGRGRCRSSSAEGLHVEVTCQKSPCVTGQGIRR
jgi:hypothetical protein